MSPWPEWATTFLASLTESPNVSEAARAADVTRRAAYKLRDANPEFKSAWDDALESATDDLVGKVWKRADTSDTLAIFLLKSHRPDVYGDKIKHQISKLSDDELVARAKAALGRNGPAGLDAPEQ